MDHLAEYISEIKSSFFLTFLVLIIFVAFLAASSSVWQLLSAFVPKKGTGLSTERLILSHDFFGQTFSNIVASLNMLNASVKHDVRIIVPFCMLSDIRISRFASYVEGEVWYYRIKKASKL